MGVLRQLAEYLYIRKDPNKPNTQWMKYMHGINRISLVHVYHCRDNNDLKTYIIQESFSSSVNLQYFSGAFSDALPPSPSNFFKLHVILFHFIDYR